MRASLAIVLHTLAVTALTAVPAPPQTPAARGGMLMGRVVDAVSTTPLSGAIVTVSRSAPTGAAGAATAPLPSPAFTSVRVMTGSDGTFVVANLPAGNFSLNVTRPGYASGALGRRHPESSFPSQSIELAEGERKGNLSIPLWKNAVLGGTVADEAGEPIVGIQVRVLAQRRFSQVGNMPVTDDRGMYRVASLSPGEYVVGIVSTQSTVPLSLYDTFNASRRDGTYQELSRELDAAGASVSFNPGVRIGDLMLMGDGGMFGGTMPIRPLPRGDRVLIYPTVFHPAAASAAQAGIIRLEAGQERSDINFQLRPVPASNVSGTISSPDGRPGRIGLVLVADGEEFSRSAGNETATTVSDDGGAFTFLGVPPGRYVIRATRVPKRPVTVSNFTSVIQVGGSTIMSGGGLAPTPPIPDEPTYWALTPVTVGASDVSGIAVALRPGGRVTGRVEFVGTTPKPAGPRLEQISVSLESADGRTAGTFFGLTPVMRGRIDADGSFKTYQLPGGRYVIRAQTPPAGWTFKSAMFDGRDLADVPFEISGSDLDGVVMTFTDRPTELSGTVRNAPGAADDTAAVLVFPVDRTRWSDTGPNPRRLASVRAGVTGAYTFPRLPAGDYHVVALAEEATANWQETSRLEALARVSTRITLVDGEKKQQDLVTVVVR